MKRNFKVLSLGTIALASGLLFRPAMAQDAQTDSVSMGLDKVLEIALSDNPDIQVADKTIEIQKYAKKETILGLFPTISVSASGTDNLIIQSIAMAGQVFKMGTDYSYGLSGTATLPLIAPQLWKTISLNQEQVELALEQARSSKVSTISQVKKAFYQLLLARDSYEVLLSSYTTADKNLTDTRNMYLNGQVAEYDTLTAYVQKLSIEPNILSAKNSVRLAEMQVKVLMGVDVAEPIRFEGHLSDYEEKLFSDLMILKEDTSLDDNTTLRQLDLQKNQLVISEKLNKLGYIPTLALSFTAGYSGMGDSFSPFDTKYYPYESLVLSFNWTLWDGGTKIMKTKQNKLSIESLDIQRDNVKKQLELSIQSSLNSIETAAEQVVDNKASVYASERAYEISERRYQVGAGTMLEMNSSETQRQSARLQYVQSVYNFVTAQATLEETLGRVVTDK